MRVTVLLMVVTEDITMEELLRVYPGAQRALFRHYHIGGCASCGFRPDETLAGVCQRNEGLDPGQVIATLLESLEQDERAMIAPEDCAKALEDGTAALVDIRTREEFDAVHIEGSRHLAQDLLQEMMATWPKGGALVLVDHQGLRALDAAAYFAGHGFTDVKALRGGIDAWSVDVDPTLPRYTLE